jgi:hypothetical protein
VVRRPAAVLIAVYGSALALFVLAPALPAVGGAGNLNTVVSDVPAMLLLGGCALALLPGRDAPGGLVLLVVGGGLLGAAFTVAGVDPLANVAKALFAGSLGLLLAHLLAEPVVVVAVPLFAAALDVFSVTAGPTELLARDSSRTGDFLSLYLPAWGGGRAGALGVADLVFVGFFASSAWRFGLRRRATAVALLAALPASLALQLATGGAFPVLPLLAAGLLLPNLDLLPRLLRPANGR